MLVRALAVPEISEVVLGETRIRPFVVMLQYPVELVVVV